MKRRIGIGAAILAGAACVAIGATGSSVSTHPVVSAARLSTAALPVSSALGPVLEIGVEHEYAASLAQTVTLDTERGAPFAISVTGTWAVAYAGETEHGEVFRAQLRGAKPSVKRGEIDASAALGDTLGKPFYFTTTSEGRLISLSFAPDVDDLARGALATLATTFQVSARGTAPAWDAVESDSIGDYQARYARRDTSLHRQRVAYDRVTGAGALEATIVASGTDVNLREDGWPADVAGHEVTRVGTPQLGVVVDATFSLKHAGVHRGVQPGSPDGMVTMAIDAASSTARSSDEEDRELVDGATLADLLAGFADITDSHARGYQYLRIAALMRLDAEAVRAAQRMVQGGASAETAGVLIGAMGEAGTPVAQRALGELLATPTLGEESRTHAAVTLGLTAAPTRDTLRTLGETAAGTGDLANTATLAQGNASLRMRDEDPQAAASQVDALLARLARAVDDEERALLLRALGNTGDPRILDAVAAALASNSITVRVAATEALRLVQGGAADQLVLARFVDVSAHVRGAAVFAITERDLAPFAAALARQVRRDPDTGVRRAIVDLAASRLDDPALRALVEHVAASDADAELRAVAKALLAG